MTNLSNLRNKILIIILCILSFLFLFSLFKNIQYPLLWNDEAETMMYAERILKFGYPKVNDGKNILYMIEYPRIEIGTDKKTNAYTATVWGYLYFAAIWDCLTKGVTDLYTKTAFIRIPFAVTGLLGLIIMVSSVIGLFRKKSSQILLFLIFFVFLELLSVSLILHMREVRYYSLLILLCSCVFYLYINHRVFQKMEPKLYTLLMTIFLFLVYNSFSPAYFVFVITLSLIELMNLFKTKDAKGFFISITPLIISFIFVIPILIFFKTFEYSNAMSKLFIIDANSWKNRIFGVLEFFRKHDFLYLIVLTKILLIWLWFNTKKPASGQLLTEKDKNKLSKDKFNNELWQKTMNTLSVSNFLSLFFVVYVFIVCKAPFPVVYERYYIVLQPVFTIILLLDIFVIYELLPNIQNPETKKRFSMTFIILAGITLIWGLPNKIQSTKSHIYEIFHQYQGPLDFVVPYLKSVYKNTEDLVIATNYEECAYMYYLGSKIIVGQAGINLAEDLKTVPDIIIFRKRTSYTITPQLFSSFIEKVKYLKVSFPVFDYPVNNIPELTNGPLFHLFKTKMPENSNQYLDIYVKQ